MRQWKQVLAAITTTLILVVSAVAQAEIVDSNANGFTVRHELEISASPEQVYESIVNDIGSWWESSHTFFGDARTMSIEARPGGCFCETGRDGQGASHMTVVLVDPARTLRLRGGLGPLQAMGVNGALTFQFERAGLTTLLKVTYGVGGHVPRGIEELGRAVDSVLGNQLGRLKRFLETGSPESARK